MDEWGREMGRRGSARGVGCFGLKEVRSRLFLFSSIGFRFVCCYFLYCILASVSTITEGAREQKKISETTTRRLGDEF